MGTEIEVGLRLRAMVQALLAGTLSMSNNQVIADFETREAAERFYECLALLILDAPDRLRP